MIAEVGHLPNGHFMIISCPSGFESRHPSLFAMAFSTRRQARQEITLPVLRAHFCDANAAEFDLNKRLLNILEEMIDSLTLENMEEFLGPV
jgi:hypothetical protein